ncbi:MAG: SNF2-related protein [Candidatus Methanomethylicaceae archaeon]
MAHLSIGKSFSDFFLPAYLRYIGRFSHQVPGRRRDPYAPAGDAAELPPVPSIVSWVKEAESKVLAPLNIDQAVYAWYEAETARRELFLSDAHLEWAKQYERYDDLYDFQKESLHFGIANFFYNDGEVRCLLADDPRLGKSIQALAILSVLCGMDKYFSQKNIIILCPKAVLYQWETYVKEWLIPIDGSPVSVVVLTGTVQERAATLAAELSKGPTGVKVFITNWEYMYYEETLIHSGWWAFVGDEAHKIKNRMSRISEYSRRVPSKHKILLSATFVEKAPTDLWSPLNIVRPEVFTSFWRFCGWFVEYTIDPFTGEHRIGNPINTDLLKEFLSPYVLQRSAKDVVSLSGKVYENIFCSLDDDVRKFYDQIKNEVFLKLTSGERLFIPNAVSMLTRLRQAAIHPSLIDPYWRLHLDSGKIDAVRNIINGLPKDEQIIVYSSFVGGCKIVQEVLNKSFGAGTCITYTGEDKQDKIKPFLDGSVRVLAATPSKGGIGLNLYVANVIIYLDLPLSSISLRQSEERVRSIGKSSPVFIYRLFARETVDLHIASLLEEKLVDIEETKIAPRILLRYFGLDSDPFI